MSNSKKNVVIISGVSSFLGRNVARFLIEKKFLVYGIIRPNSNRLNGLSEIENLNLISLDFNKYSIKDIIEDSIKDFKNFDYKNIANANIYFIHFAWGATLDRNNFMEQMYNIDYSIKVLEFAKKLNVKKFIFAGSQAEMSDSAYGIAKKEFAERALKLIDDKNMQFIHLRIFSIYGAEDRETTLIKSLVKSIKENKDIDLSSCNYKWNFLFIEDFTQIIYMMIKNDIETNIYDIASDDTRLLKDYVIETYNVLKGKNKLNFGKRADSNEKFAIPNICNMLKVIGDFKFTKFSDGILKV